MYGVTTYTISFYGLFSLSDFRLVLDEGEKGEDQYNHGKKSVLRRVKAKATKIKDTIKKHGHGHNFDHEYRHISDDHDLDKEDEQDEFEGIVQDPEVHGAPSMLCIF